MEREFTLPVTGMTRANCAMNIERSVRKAHGEKSVNVNFASEQAVITCDPEKLRLKDVVENISDSGFSVASSKIELPVMGMTCANCAANVERALNR